MSRLARPRRPSHDDTTGALQVLIRYLEGHHYGDMEKLRSAIRAPTPMPVSRALDTAWLTPFATRPAPADQGESFSYQILSIDVDGDQAVAMLNSTLTDDPLQSVTLHRAEGTWYVDAVCVSDAECGP